MTTTVFVEGEKRLWKGGLVGSDVWIGLLGAAAHSPTNELTTQAGADYFAANYARVRVRPAGWTVAAATGIVSNAAAVNFADPGAGAEDWPGALAFILFDAAAGGNPLIAAAIPGAPPVGAEGDPVTFALGAITIDI